MRQTGNSRVLLAVLSALMAGAVLLLVIKPQGSDLSDARSRSSALESDLQEAQMALRELEDGSSSADGGADGAALSAAVPADPGLSSLLRDLQTVAAETGMAYSSVAPSPPGPNPAGPGASMQLSISASGPLAAVDSYLARIRDMARLVTVEQVSKQLATTPGSSLVSLQITARVFTTDQIAIS